MRSISARDLRQIDERRHRVRSRAGGKRADPAALLGIGLRQVPGFLFRVHGGSARFLRRRVLGDDFERIAQHRCIIGADRADIGAAAAAGDDAGAAQDALPEIEAVLGAQQLLLLRRIRLGDDARDVLAQLGEAVRRTKAVAGRPVARPMPDGIGRTGLEAAPAARPEAQRVSILLSHATSTEQRTAVSSTRGPNSGVSNCRLSPSVPSPASTAACGSDSKRRHVPVRDRRHSATDRHASAAR